MTSSPTAYKNRFPVSQFSKVVYQLLDNSYSNLAEELADNIVVFELNHAYLNKAYNDNAKKLSKINDDLAADIDRLLITNKELMFDEVARILEQFHNKINNDPLNQYHDNVVYFRP